MRRPDPDPGSMPIPFPVPAICGNAILSLFMDLGVHATCMGQQQQQQQHNRMTIDVAALEEAATARCKLQLVCSLCVRHADSADDDLVGVAGSKAVACGMRHVAGGTLLATLHWRILTVLY